MYGVALFERYDNGIISILFLTCNEMGTHFCLRLEREDFKTGFFSELPKFLGGVQTYISVTAQMG